MSTSDLNSDLATPRDEDYWEPFYRELALLPEWAELDEETRAQRLLDRIEQEVHAPDAPAQIKALLCGTQAERLQAVRHMIRHFGRA
jgi:hypothetical protein